MEDGCAALIEIEEALTALLAEAPPTPELLGLAAAILESRDLWPGDASDVRRLIDRVADQLNATSADRSYLHALLAPAR
jgi:hypothetical protein